MGAARPARVGERADGVAGVDARVVVLFGPLDRRELATVLVRDGARLVGLAPLLARPVRDRIGVPLRRLEPLGTGEDERDEVCSDYVSVIAERGEERAVASEVASALASGALGAWDELLLPSMNGDSAMPVHLASALRDEGAVVEPSVTGLAHYVRLPSSWDDYLASLSSSRRYFLRRSVRDFEKWADGTARVERVATRDDLARGVAVLASLHGERWSRDGHDGAFASDRFRAFHEAVMPELLDAGALELAWLVAHGEPVAAVYNIAWGGVVHFYQSGRSVRVPSEVRPGIALHAYAIEEAIAAGRREYDFSRGARATRATSPPTCVRS